MRRFRIRVAGLVAVSLVAAAVGAVVAATPAAASVSGWETIRGLPSATNSDILKKSTAFCSANKVVVGFGYELNGSTGDIILDDMIPSTSSVTVQAGEDGDGTSLSWNVVAWAVCAFRPAGYEIRAMTSATGPGTLRPATATCTGNRQVIGSGASLSAGFGQISVSNLLLADTSVTAWGTDDQDGFTGSWSITAYAICADPLPGLRSATDSSLFDSDGQKRAAPVCTDRPGQVPLGFGWGIGGGGQVVAVFGRVDAARATVIASEDDDGFFDNWSIGVTVRCANL
jgi:hypothetical protein